jgi:hypothetical protein
MNKKSFVWFAVMAFGIALCGAFYLYQARTAGDSSIAINSSMESANASGADSSSPGNELNETNSTATNQTAFTIPLEKPPFIE